MFLQIGGLPLTARPPGKLHWTFRGLDIGFSLVQGIVTGIFVSRGAHWTEHRSGSLPRPA